MTKKEFKEYQSKLRRAEKEYDKKLENAQDVCLFFGNDATKFNNYNVEEEYMIQSLKKCIDALEGSITARKAKDEIMNEFANKHVKENINE